MVSLEMGRGIVDRHAGVLGDGDHDQGDEAEAGKPAEAHAGGGKEACDIGQEGGAEQEGGGEDDQKHGGSAKAAIIISRLDPMPPKLVPIEPRRAMAKRAAPMMATSAIRSAMGERGRRWAKLGTSAAASQREVKVR
jgi:hypothetical protein